MDPIEQIMGGVAFAAMSVIFLMVFRIVPKFTAMFADFGGKLPWVTRFLIVQWPMAIYAAGVGIALGVGVRARRSWIMGAFFAGLIGVGFCFWALYAPIFELAGNIKAD